MAPEMLLEIDPACVLVLNPNYRDEISHRLNTMGLSTEIIDMMQDVVLAATGQP